MHGQQNVRTIPSFTPKQTSLGVKLGISVLRNSYFRKQCKGMYEENREVVRREWRKLHNEELSTFLFTIYYYGDCIREN